MVILKGIDLEEKTEEENPSVGGFSGDEKEFRKKSFLRVLITLKDVAEKIEPTPEQQESYGKKLKKIRNCLIIAWLYLRAFIEFLKQKYF